MDLRTILLTILMLAAAVPAALASDMQPVRKIRPGIPPHEVIGNFTRANTRLVTGLVAEKPPGAAQPVVTWLADCQAEVRSELLAVFPGQLFYTVRNLGFQLATSTGAVDYGVRRLHTPVLLITGNTGNEAIRLFMEGYQNFEPEIRRDLNHLYLPLVQPAPTPKEPERFQEQWLANVERNVDYQVSQALERYQERVADGRLVVVGSILDLDNVYGQGRGRLLIININGEVEEAKLRQSPHVVRMEPEIRAAVLGRKKGK